MAFFQRATWACVLLALLSGCAQTPEWANWSSWFDKHSAAHSSAKGDLAPAPDAAPVSKVQAEPLSSPQFSGSVKIGILLPLSGPNAALGHAMLNAAQQAAYDAGAMNFELMPRDTGGGPESAAAAAHEAITNGARLLVGPLFAAQVPTVYKVTSAANIPMLTLSTDTSLAAPGLYVMGFAPEAQAERIAHYAVSRGMRRFAAIIPNTTYGNLVAQSFQLAVAEEGATMVTLDTYDPAQHNSNNAVRDIADKSGVIDALFLPESGSDLTIITQQLAAEHIDTHKMRLLGTGLWDAPNMGQDVNFIVGGWYAAANPNVRQGFVAAYRSTYNEEPPRLSTLAYDATALAAVLAKRGGKFDQAALTNPNGFAGLDGIFRLKRNGDVERGLAVLEVDTEGSHVIDGAPSRFMSAH